VAVVDLVVQRRKYPDPRTFLGSGKLREVLVQALEQDVELLICDPELSASQAREISEQTDLRVIDRTMLILDIFAQHARSSDGKLQVELAQLRYRLPRLRGRGLMLSQQGAGIGTRGPGETQLEVDRRRILRRVTKLEHDLARLASTRATQRKARKRREIPQVALVGYTNAGKSTLLNRLTKAGVLVQNQLFSTLDPTVRRLHLPGGETVVLSDTVGFVRRLPHQLVEAFRSTLEEVVDADLLLHVVDASAPDNEARIEAVNAVLREIGADSVPVLLAWNKSDLADPDDVKLALAAHPGSVAISAATGEGVSELLASVGDRLRALATVTEFVVPYDRGDILAALHRAGEVLVEVHDDDGTRVRARLPQAAAGRFSEFAITTA
jgi:GTP-binding protein HflX